MISRHPATPVEWLQANRDSAREDERSQAARDRAESARRRTNRQFVFVAVLFLLAGAFLGYIVR